MSLPTSTPSRRSTKFTLSDDNPSRPSSIHSQDELKHVVRDELENQTWQFDPTIVARMLSAKRRRSPLNPHNVDTIDDYEDIKIDKIDTNTLNKAANLLKSSANLPKSKSEPAIYEPLCVFLNSCVQACGQVLGDTRGKLYRDLKFIVWDHPMADGIAGASPLKPDLGAGKGLPKRDTIKTGGGLYWRPPELSNYQLLIPVEVKGNWAELVCQAGTYARCLFSASPLRQFALVLGYNHIKQEFRFLIFHHGGLTSSLPLNPNSQTGQQDILRIFVAILSWETPAHAGFPMWCNDSEMMLPASATGDENILAQVKKVLHQNFCIRGRAPQVSLMSTPDESQTNLPPDAVIPTAESMCSKAPPRRQQGLSPSMEEGDASKQHGSGSGSRWRSGNSKTIVSGPRSRGVLESAKSKTIASGSRSRREPESAKSKTIASGSRSRGEPESAKSKAIAISRRNIKYPIRYIKQHIFEPSSENMKNFNLAPPGLVVKTSWVSIATRGIEPDLLRDCSGLFGTPKHYCSFLAYHDDNSPATNHLFLPARGVDLKPYFWALFRQEPPSLPDYRGLWVYVSAYAGHSLVPAASPKALIESVFHACLGWFNMIQRGYQHRDISIGNIVMLDKGIKTKAFEVGENVTVDDITKKLEELKIDLHVAWEKRLVTALRDLEITDMCHGFVIDGDMAIKIADYFTQKHGDSRSGTYEFMSDELLRAMELEVGYLQSPVDDLFSFYFTMQWAAAFNNTKFSNAETIPLDLDWIRQGLSGSCAERSLATHKIIDPAKLKEDRYGQFLVGCHPFLRSWYSSLLGLNDEFQECHSQLQESNLESENDAYTALFLRFAVQGVAQLAQLVHSYLKATQEAG